MANTEENMALSGADHKEHTERQARFNRPDFDGEGIPICTENCDGPRNQECNKPREICNPGVRALVKRIKELEGRVGGCDEAPRLEETRLRFYEMAFRRYAGVHIERPLVSVIADDAEALFAEFQKRKGETP